MLGNRVSMSMLNTDWLIWLSAHNPLTCNSLIFPWRTTRKHEYKWKVETQHLLEGIRELLEKAGLVGPTCWREAEMEEWPPIQAQRTRGHKRVRKSAHVSANQKCYQQFQSWVGTSQNSRREGSFGVDKILFCILFWGVVIQLCIYFQNLQIYTLK